MKLKAKILSSLFIAMLVIGMTFAIPTALAATTVTMVSDVTQLGDGTTFPDVRFDTFKVAIIATELADFYGFDIQANWNTAYVQYVSHVVTVPAATYPAPNPPSTYGGALNAPTLEVKNIIDQDGGIPDADPASMCWFAYASMLPAAPQSGGVTMAVFTFQVVDQPIYYGGPVVPIDLVFHFTATSLASSAGTGITHTAVDLHLNLYPREFALPTLPELVVTPAAQVGGPFDADVTLTTDPYWDVAGFDFILHYDPTLIQATTDVIDPDGWFANFWPGGIFIALNTIDNTAGEVHVAFLGIPAELGAHTAPYGSGRLLTVHFVSIFVSTSYPAPTCALALWNPPPRPMPDPTNWDVTYFQTDMAGWPHPELSQPPWNGAESSVPIPHTIVNGLYTAPVQPMGRVIDVVTIYGGVGPDAPGGAFGPQSTVRLTATVTYNGNPVQQKDVTFEIIHGEWDLVLCARTDANGVAWIEFGLPWPCDDPEGRVFGTWFASASVDIREVYTQDTITWQVGYLINIISVVGQPDASFAIGEHLSFKVSYNSISTVDQEAWFSIVVFDDLNVPVAWFLVGPYTISPGAGEIVIECKILPKHTFVGLGHAYVNILFLTPDRLAFLQYGPQYVLEVPLTLAP